MNIFQQQKYLGSITDDNQVLALASKPGEMQQAAMMDLMRRKGVRQKALAQQPQGFAGGGEVFGIPRGVDRESYDELLRERQMYLDGNPPPLTGASKERADFMDNWSPQTEEQFSAGLPNMEMTPEIEQAVMLYKLNPSPETRERVERAIRSAAIKPRESSQFGSPKPERSGGFGSPRGGGDPWAQRGRGGYANGGIIQSFAGGGTLADNNREMTRSEIVSDVERKKGMPPGSLRTIWTIESSQGEDLQQLGPKTKYGHARGPFQMLEGTMQERGQIPETFRGHAERAADYLIQGAKIHGWDKAPRFYQGGPNTDIWGENNDKYLAKYNSIMGKDPIASSSAGGVASVPYTGDGAIPVEEVNALTQAEDQSGLEALVEKLKVRKEEETSKLRRTSAKSLMSEGRALPADFSGNYGYRNMMGLAAADRQNPVGYAQGGIIGYADGTQGDETIGEKSFIERMWDELAAAGVPPEDIQRLIQEQIDKFGDEPATPPVGRPTPKPAVVSPEEQEIAPHATFTHSQDETRRLIAERDAEELADSQLAPPPPPLNVAPVEPEAGIAAANQPPSEEQQKGWALRKEPIIDFFSNMWDSAVNKSNNERIDEGRDYVEPSREDVAATNMTDESYSGSSSPPPKQLTKEELERKARFDEVNAETERRKASAVPGQTMGSDVTLAGSPMYPTDAGLEAAYPTSMPSSRVGAGLGAARTDVYGPRLNTQYERSVGRQGRQRASDAQYRDNYMRRMKGLMAIPGNRGLARRNKNEADLWKEDRLQRNKDRTFDRSLFNDTSKIVGAGINHERYQNAEGRRDLNAETAARNSTKGGKTTGGLTAANILSEMKSIREFNGDLSERAAALDKEISDFDYNHSGGKETKEQLWEKKNEIVLRRQQIQAQIDANIQKMGDLNEAVFRNRYNSAEVSERPAPVDVSTFGNVTR